MNKLARPKERKYSRDVDPVLTKYIDARRSGNTASLTTQAAKMKLVSA